MTVTVASVRALLKLQTMMKNPLNANFSNLIIRFWFVMYPTKISNNQLDIPNLKFTAAEKFASGFRFYILFRK